ncbi:tyrosine-type recombinase/integrase [Cohnella yongneupensis]|uniref:Tyrosine-type recombinase/integrase n=1 Tax=Cohnella yongneupensis TaxID=425006 RepID=A0ABW0R3X4_9BACL
MASLQKRGNDTWLLVVEAGFGSKGKRVKKTKTVKGMKRREAEKELAKFQTEVEAGEYIAPTKATFVQFAQNEWIPKYAKKVLSPLSMKTYVYHLEHTLFPAIGHRQLHEIKTMHIVSLFDDLDKTVLSGSTKLYIFKVMKSVFNQAVKWRIIPKNPMDGADRPKAEKSKPRFYDEIEAQQVIAALLQEPTKWKLFFLGAMLGGFRRGELVALEWTDVNIAEESLLIRKSISLTINGQAQEKSPKTEGSTRSVDMPKWFMEELRRFRHTWLEQKMQCGNKWLGGERQYVFHNGDGRPFYHNTPSMTWRRFIARHGLPEARLHDLRHTAATLLIESDTDLKAVQERLGHAKYSTTANLYAHVTKKLSKQTAAKLDKFDPAINFRQQSVNKS